MLGTLTSVMSKAASSGVLKDMTNKATALALANKPDMSKVTDMGMNMSKGIVLHARAKLPPKYDARSVLSSVKNAALSAKDAASSAQRITAILTKPFNMLNLILEPTKNETEIRELLKIASTNLAAKTLLSAKGITISETSIEQIMIVLKNEKFQTFIRSILTDNLHEKIIPYFTHKDHIGSSALLASDLLNGNCDGLNAELIEKIKQFNPTVGNAQSVIVTPPSVTPQSGTDTVTPSSGTDTELTPMEEETSKNVQESILTKIETEGSENAFAKSLMDGIINGVVNNKGFIEKVKERTEGGAKKTRRKRKPRKTRRKLKPKRNKTKSRK